MFLNSKIFILTTTFDSLQKCTTIANEIIKAKLAACCQIEEITSIYNWKGEIANEKEFRLVCKTLKADELVDFIKVNHSYEIPEIIIQEVYTTDEYFNFVSGI